MTIEFTSEQYELVKALICPMCKYKIPEVGISDGWQHSLAKTPLQRVACLANDFRVEFHRFGGGVIRVDPQDSKARTEPARVEAK